MGFQLADWIRSRRPDRNSERNAHRRHRALRQFREQQVQPGSHEADPLGTAELGRNAELLYGISCGSSIEEPGWLVQGIRSEPAASRQFRTDSGVTEIRPGSFGWGWACRRGL